MTVPGILQIVLFMLLILLLAKPLGDYMARVFSEDRTLLCPIEGRTARSIQRIEPSAP